jgi:hypothetical protein
MPHRSRRATALLLAAVVAAAAPAAATAAARPPLDTNLLKNAGFNATPTSTSSIPGWTVSGTVRTETFGTRSFPYPAYGRKYHGGARYLSCYGGRGGLVRQTIDVAGWQGRTFKLRARIATSLGGVTGHRVRVSLRATGSGQSESAQGPYTPPSYTQKMRTLEITNHYKRATTALTLPAWTERVVATIQLLPKQGSTVCKVMADSAEVFLYRG